MEFYYVYLPEGNRPEFPELDEELIRREIPAEFAEAKGGGRVYRIPDTHYTKLPYDKDAKEHYLGDDSSGYHIYKDRTEMQVFFGRKKPVWKSVNEMKVIL